MSRTLNAEELTALLAPKPKTAKPQKRTGHPPPPQRGPLRYYDKERRCMTSGYWGTDLETNERVWKKGNACNSPTHYEFKGVPICIAHAIDKMNELLFEMGVDK